MPLHLVCQQRAGTPSIPAAPVEAAPVEAPAGGAGELSQPLCQAANKYQWIGAGTYDAGALAVGVLAFVVMKKRLVGTRSVRYAVALALAGGFAAVLSVLDPMRADDVARCMHSAEYARFIMLGGAAAARVVALGVIPSVVLAWVGCMLANRTY